MSNIRWGVIAGAVAFILSFSLGLVQHGAGIVHIVHVIVRALIFTAVFFGMGLGAYFLITNFMPELLVFNDKNASSLEGLFPGLSSGSRVDITVADTSGAALPENYEGSADGSEIGNLPDLISGLYNPAANARLIRNAGAFLDGQGVDLERTDGYNYEGEGDLNTETQDSLGFGDVFSMNSGEAASGGLDKLSDLGDMGGFLGNDSFEKRARPDEIFEPERSPTGNKPQELQGDFNPKEIALGIRTVLSKDK